MPKRTDIQSILIIGAGPIVIGQAAEFDYSGSQAVKALKSEGYRVIRFTNADVMTNLDGVLRTILIALGRDPPSPRPLQGERERRGKAEPGRGGR